MGMNMTTAKTKNNQIQHKQESHSLTLYTEVIMDFGDQEEVYEVVVPVQVNS